jgi:pyruvate dehydrogenase E2 component (dihydrolipoamide acetyltransferase)
VPVAAKPGPAPAKPAAPPPAVPAAKPGPVDDFVATGPIAAAPAVRREARELGIDLRRVRGSGPAGRIVAEDLHRYAAALSAGAGAGVEPEPEAEAGYDEPTHAAPGTPVGIPFFELEPLPDFSAFGATEREALRSIRRKVARRMVTSMVMVPHVALLDEADVTELDLFRRREQERRAGQPGAKLSLLSFVVKSIATGLVDFPMFNASIDPFKEELVYKKYYSVGIATDTPKGLMVPVVKNADRKSISEIAAEIEQLALRARAGAIDVADLRGGTFSITNVGPLGGKGLIPTINYPECAILGMGRAEQRPVVRDGQIVVRTILPLTLTFDHRIADGADAARFMGAVIRRLSDPLGWLLEA